LELIVLNAIWLETFTTLCEIGHFTQTAQRLGMTQPGVSQHLRKLEAQVGRPLISQDGKSFTLTRAGEAVSELGRARRAQERSLREAMEADDPDTGEVSIGCSGSFAMWLYPHLIERMSRAPGLVTRLTAAPHTSILSAVLNGEIDLGIVTRQVDHARLTSVQFASEELCLIVPAAFDARTLNLENLDGLGFVAHPDGYVYADDLFGLNFPDDYRGSDRLNLRTFVNQIGQIPIPVARGLGYTILPKSGINAFGDQKDIAIVSLPKRRHQDLWLISRKRRAEFATVAAIVDLIHCASAAL
jgi:DNA-binding transcriptional LysR family regulator